jgi:FKBP-type peptidyl-prolyl cis-trans isomerase
MKRLFANLATLALLTGLLAPALWSCNSETDFAKAQREHTEQYKAIDDTLIRGYLNRQHITNYTRTESGLYVINTADGTGPFIKTGNQVAVKYIGRLLGYANSGQIFENSNENRDPCRCGNFTVGQQIEGWNEGLQLMQAGTRKTLLIPSYMAYGATGSGSIGPDQPLSFEMEILGVLR